MWREEIQRHGHLLVQTKRVASSAPSAGAWESCGCALAATRLGSAR